MTIGLNAFRDEAPAFLAAIGASSEDIGVILRALDEEMAGLKVSIADRSGLADQVYDVLFLLFELAARYDLDLDSEWEKGRARKQEKYLIER